jgi:dUTP pyrophosphatase
VLLLNTDADETVELAAGDRIAQLVLIRVQTPVVEEVAELGRSDRDTRGFGSSG